MEQCLGQYKHKSLHPVPPLSCVVDSGQTVQVHSVVKIPVNDKPHTYPPVGIFLAPVDDVWTGGNKNVHLETQTRG